MSAAAEAARAAAYRATRAAGRSAAAARELALTGSPAAARQLRERFRPFTDPQPPDIPFDDAEPPRRRRR